MWRLISSRDEIATWNVNDINKRLANLLEWLRAATPDVACLQELEGDRRGIPSSCNRASRLRAVWRGQRSWNGVAIRSPDYRHLLLEQH